MIFTWMVMIAVAVDSASGAMNGDVHQPCAKIHTSSLVVPLGSPITATCVIRQDCYELNGEDVHIAWYLGTELIPSSLAVNESNMVSRIVVPSFNHTREELICGFQDPRQDLAGVVIKAGYPPEKPENLSCRLIINAFNSLICTWDPGQLNTSLPTKYTLYTETRDLNSNNTYEVPPDIHHVVISRADFGIYMAIKIYVKAENDLGEATSAEMVFKPISVVKLDQPSIVKIGVVPKRFGCLQLTWKLSKQQAWLHHNPFNLDIRLKTADSSQPILVSYVKSPKKVECCSLLDGTQYLAQIRVQCEQSPWSEWSSSKSGVTLETAPTGPLDSWMKVSKNKENKNLNIQLFWKPSKLFSANGRNLSYVVSQPKLRSKRKIMCSTSEKCCAFQPSKGARKFFLSAVNSAGKSHPTEIRIYQPQAQMAIMDVTAVPHADRSFLVQWTADSNSDLIDYVVEWKPLLNTDLCKINFEIVNKSQCSLIITGSFEPYKPYGISVYPRFKDGIGLPQTVNAYLRQEAPSVVPELKIKQNWNSDIEISWEEIPLEQRNGFIKGYKVFYWEENGPVKAVSTDAEDRRVILKDINPVSLYEAFMMVSTFGGSLNGTTIRFKFTSSDQATIVIIATASGTGLTILILLLLLACFSKHKTMDRRLWPVVPDPANSSIKRWSSESTQFSHPSWDNNEPNPIYLSHLSFLDLTTKLSKEQDDIWLNSKEETSDLPESICGSVFMPTYSSSNSESVHYATMLPSSSCSSPKPNEPVYLRSESTQPLLEAEESLTPRHYQNVPSDGMPKEQCFFGPCDDDIPEEQNNQGVIWDDFPFLRALAMNEREHN